MATFSKIKLSGSTNGRGIAVAATSTLGTTIHATGTSASVLDEVWLYAANIHSSAVTLTAQVSSSVVLGLRRLPSLHLLELQTRLRFLDSSIELHR